MYDKIKQQLYKQLLALAANHGLPKAINLAVYDSDAALKLFRPNEAWAGGCNEHTALMGALKSDVEQDFGLKVNLVLIDTNDFIKWAQANGKDIDDDAARAEYIATR